jgi:hypothetical protein
MTFSNNSIKVLYNVLNLDIHFLLHDKCDFIIFSFHICCGQLASRVLGQQFSSIGHNYKTQDAGPEGFWPSGRDMSSPISHFVSPHDDKSLCSMDPISAQLMFFLSFSFWPIGLRCLTLNTDKVSPQLSCHFTSFHLPALATINFNQNSQEHSIVDIGANLSYVAQLSSKAQMEINSLQ